MIYRFLQLVLLPVLHFLYRIRVEGGHHVPRIGPAILASNHLSFSDSIFLLLVLRRQVTFMVKAEYFERPPLAWLFRALGQIPMSGKDGAPSPAGSRAVQNVLARGHLLGIHPEGPRSPDGRLHKGHTGVARLALETGAPVLAVAMVGTREIQPVGQMLPRFFMPVTIRFSRPMTFEHYQSRAHDPFVLRQVTDEVMFELRELSGQEYVNSYAVREGWMAATGAETTGAVATGVVAADVEATGVEASEPAAPGAEATGAEVASDGQVSRRFAIPAARPSAGPTIRSGRAPLRQPAGRSIPSAEPRNRP